MSSACTDSEIVTVLALASELGIASPEPHHEICDDDSGEVLATVDVAWQRKYLFLGEPRHWTMTDCVDLDLGSNDYLLNRALLYITTVNPP